jgi:hypothetical protein
LFLCLRLRSTSVGAGEVSRSIASRAIFDAIERPADPGVV